MYWITFLIASVWMQAGAATGVLPAFGHGGDDLAPYLERAAGATDKAGIAEMKRALALSKAGNAAGAVKAFERAAELAPGLADWARALAADAAATAGDTSAVRRLLASTEPGLATEWGWRARVSALRAAGDRPAAIAVALSASTSLSDDGRRADASLVAANLYLARGDTAAATVQLRRAMLVAPGSTSGIDAARTLSALPGLTADDHGRIGRLYVRHGNLDRGMAGIDRWVAAGTAPTEELAQARLELGRALFNARRYDIAERRLLSLADAGAPASIAAEALFLAGRSQYRLGRTERAQQTFAATATRFPAEKGAAEALYILGDLEHDAGRLTAARGYYRRAMTASPESEAAADAAMRLGGLAFAAGDVMEAALVFESCRSAHRSGPRYQRATYWAGRSYLQAGDTMLGRQRLRETRSLDPTSFYGLRAADRLGDPAWHADLKPSPVTGDQGRRETAGALRRLDALDGLGLDRAAAFELDRLRRHFAGRDAALYALAEAMHERDRTFMGIRLGREIQRSEGEWNERLLRIVYPFPFREPIVREARRRGVDPYLAAGLVRQESLFNPTAVSSAGAIGLMQVMPRTGRVLATRQGIKSFNPRSLRTPDLNVRLGMHYLADMLDRYAGQVNYTLAAYNAGPSRVARWRTHAEAVDPDLFAERIPFDETRDYVKVVQQNAEIYRALYGN